MYILYFRSKARFLLTLLILVIFLGSLTVIPTIVFPHIRSTSQLQVNSSPYAQYVSPLIQFKYPSDFNMNIKTFAGDEILFHSDLQKVNSQTHAIVELWKLKQSLKSFLEQSKSTSQQNYKYFKSYPVVVNGLEGYVWESIISSNNTLYHGLELFSQDGDKMKRISYFAPNDSWEKSDYETFWTMANSLH